MVHYYAHSNKRKQTGQLYRDEETRQDEDLCDRGYRRDDGRQLLC